MAIPTGFLGLHHFYLENPLLGMIYLVTGGLFGIGWLIDIFRMPCLVASANKRLEANAASMNEIRQRLGGACVMTDRSNIVIFPNNNQSPGKSHSCLGCILSIIDGLSAFSAVLMHGCP
jgi:TM2 domain